jgi:hypothetical protein
LGLSGATPGDGSNIIDTLQVDATPRDVLKLFDLVHFTDFEYSHLHRGHVTNCDMRPKRENSKLTLLFEQPQIQAQGNFPIKDVMRRYFLALCFQHSWNEEMGKFCRVVLNGFKETVNCPESVTVSGGSDNRAYDMKIASQKDGTELTVRDLFSVESEEDKAAFDHADVSLCKNENEAAQNVALRAMQIMCAVGTHSDANVAWDKTIDRDGGVYLPDWCYGSKNGAKPEIIDWVEEAANSNFPCLHGSQYLDGEQSDLLPIIDEAKAWLNKKMNKANKHYGQQFLEDVVAGNASQYNQTRWDFIKGDNKRDITWDNNASGTDVVRRDAQGKFESKGNYTGQDPKMPMACVAYALIRSQLINVINIGGARQVVKHLNSEKILERLNKVIKRVVTVWADGKPHKTTIESAPRALRNRENVGNLPSELQDLITAMENHTKMKEQLNSTNDNQMRTTGVFGYNETTGLNSFGLKNFEEYFQNEFFRMQAVLNEQSGNKFKVIIEAPFTVTVSVGANGCLRGVEEDSIAVKTDEAKLIGPGGQPILGVDIGKTVLDKLTNTGGLGRMFADSGVIECVLNQMNEQKAGCARLPCIMDSLASADYI